MRSLGISIDAGWPALRGFGSYKRSDRVKLFAAKWRKRDLAVNFAPYAKRVSGQKSWRIRPHHVGSGIEDSSVWDRTGVSSTTRICLRRSSSRNFNLEIATLNPVDGSAVWELLQALLASWRDKRRAVNFAPQAKRHMGPKLFAEASPVM